MSETAPKVQAYGDFYTAPWKRLWRNTVNLLTSMEMGILLLVFIALACVAGSLLPQETLVDAASIQRQFGDATPYLQAMGLFNLFYSPWFIALEVLFFISITFGSFRWLRPAWRSIRSKTLMDARHIRTCARRDSIEVSQGIPAPEILATLKMVLEQKGFDVFGPSAKNPRSLYATKGWLGRVGPMVVHFALALILVALFWGYLTSFTAQHLIKPGETFSLPESETFQTITEPPFWFGRIPRWRVRVSEFDIAFQPDAPRIPKQFTSTVEILAPFNDTLLARGETSVNHPFTYDGITFYQANFAPTTLHRVQVNGEVVTLNAENTLAGRPFATYPVDANTRLFAFPLGRFTDGLSENRMHFLLEKNGRLVGFEKGFSTENKNMLALSEGEAPQAFQGIKLAYEEAVIATGLQMKYAPETTLLYLSFGILLLGVLLSFIPHYQVWFALDNAVHDDRIPNGQLLVYIKARKRKRQLAEALEAAYTKLPVPLYKRKPNASL